MRAYYSAYVQHCIRFYIHNPEPEFTREAERLDWEAVRDVFSGLGTTMEGTACELYETPAADLEAKIGEVAVRDNVTPRRLWQFLNTIEESVAHRRGLL